MLIAIEPDASSRNNYKKTPHHTCHATRICLRLCGTCSKSRFANRSSRTRLLPDLGDAIHALMTPAQLLYSPLTPSPSWKRNGRIFSGVAAGVRIHSPGLSRLLVYFRIIARRQRINNQGGKGDEETAVGSWLPWQNYGIKVSYGLPQTSQTQRGAGRNSRDGSSSST